MSWYSRTQMLLEDEQFQKLQNSHILVVGLGGVGGFAAECICRANIGQMTIADCDIISTSNRNRQILALSSTEGKKKTEVLANRLLDINPRLNLAVNDQYLLDDTIVQLFDQGPYDYVIDAIDTLTPKVQLITQALERKTKIVSAMGAGAKFDPRLIKIDDISGSKKCPLAQRLRIRLRKHGISCGFKVVYSTENFDRSKFINTYEFNNKKTIVGTISYMPPIFGGYCASVVVNDILSK